MKSRYILLILFPGAAAACSPTDNAKDPAGQNAPAAPAGDSLSSQSAYDRVCAACRDAGLDDAPAVDDRQAWASRSPLWVAVLAEHAQEGFLDMPARGSDPGLSALEEAAAAEYLMTLPHPDRRGD